MTPTDSVLQFIEAINTQDVELLLELMTPDHTFINSDGTEIRGREAMRAPWESYFEMVPDYSITVDETLASGGTVVVLGLATGTFAVEGQPLPQHRWQVPAAWRGSVKGGLIAEWQVFVDNEPLRQIARSATGAREE
jgi:uncharacterized protein (TIGR02246 family)